MDDKAQALKRNKEFSSCKHIWLINNGERVTKKCLKCGLTDEVFYNDQLPECKIMKKYILKHTGTLIRGKIIESKIDYDIVKIIYERIKDKHNFIDDETIKKYIEISIYKINNKKEDKYKKSLKRIKQYNK